MRANDYNVLDYAVEVGVARCARRLSKAGLEDAARQLEDEDVKSIIEDTLMTEICQWFRFDDVH